MNYYNKGTKYLSNKNYIKALNCFKKSSLECKELYLNIGNAYRMMGDYINASEYYLKANSNDVKDFNGVGGSYALALCNLGLLTYAIGDNDSAINLYKASLSLDPLGVDALWNCSNALLRDWCSGGTLDKDAWALYNYRFKALKPLQTDGIPRWDGKSKVFKLLVLAEQGLGDKIMFGRYLPYLEEYCRELVVLVDPSLGTLFDYKTVTSTVGDYDACVPFGELASIFGVVPGNYLQGKFPNVELSDKLNVIVEWEGSSTHANNANRSCYGSYFTKLSKYANLYNVRPNARKVAGVTNLNCSTWAESASVVSSADLVISVDTSIVHLAGSLGVNTWLLQPTIETDFRWGIDALKKRYGMPLDNNIWYDSVHVFDNPGWDELFKDIENRLACIKK